MTLTSPALAGRFFTTAPPRKPMYRDLKLSLKIKTEITKISRVFISSRETGNVKKKRLQKRLLAGDRVGFLDRKDPLEEEMATHSSILAWETP